MTEADHTPTWQVQEAKQRFSEVLRAAAKRPQTITKNGTPVAVVVDIDDYRAHHDHDTRPAFADALLAGLDLDGFELPARRRDTGRAPDLFADA
jgi:prevent-host-death family protein